MTQCDVIWCWIVLDTQQASRRRTEARYTQICGLLNWRPARLFFLRLVWKCLWICRGKTLKKEQLLVYLQDMVYQERDVHWAIVCMQCQAICRLIFSSVSLCLQCTRTRAVREDVHSTGKAPSTVHVMWSFVSKDALPCQCCCCSRCLHGHACHHYLLDTLYVFLLF